MPSTNLEGFVGEDRDYPFAPAAGATNISLVGATLSFQIKATASRTAAILLTKTTGSGITLTNAAAGEFTVALRLADWGAVPPGSYRWEVARTDSGSRRVLANGQFNALEHAVSFS